MKTFPSNASRLRTLLQSLRIGGWIALALALIYLLSSFLFQPKDLLKATPATNALPHPTATSRPDLIAILASRSLREEIKPPLPVAAATPPVKVIHPPDVDVVATIVNPGEAPSAYVRSRASKKLVNIKLGGIVEGATVKDITEGQVIFELQGQDFSLQVGRKGS